MTDNSSNLINLGYKDQDRQLDVVMDFADIELVTSDNTHT